VNGQCTLIPGQDNIPHDAKVHAYPTVERHRLIWIWMGDPEKADPSKIEDFHWLDDPEWEWRGERLDLKANYFFLVENLLDLSHLSYVHRTTLGTDRVAETPMSWEEHGDGVRVTRWIMDSPAPPFFQKAGDFEPAQNVDRWQIIDWTPPSVVRLDVGCAISGTGAREGNRSRGISLRNLNAITPETEGTTHYFWATARNFKLDKRFVTDLVFNNVHTAFMEDVEVLAAQQENHDLNPNARRVNMRHDGGGIAARRKIEHLIAVEEAES
jgi:phenylpropionate dioxygenase-like ring-hydroxylating dioxygenase large terminal subunit